MSTSPHVTLREKIPSLFGFNIRVDDYVEPPNPGVCELCPKFHKCKNIIYLTERIMKNINVFRKT